MLFGVLVDVDIRVRSSAILLIALVGGVLLDVALLPLLVRILRTLLVARSSRGHLLAVAGSLRALVLGGNRWHLAGHDAVSCCWSATSTEELIAASDVSKTTRETTCRSYRRVQRNFSESV